MSALLSACVVLTDADSRAAESAQAVQELPPIEVIRGQPVSKKLSSQTRKKPTPQAARIVVHPTALVGADARSTASGPAAAQSMASQITVSGEKLRARPVARPGELLEAVPGLIVTQHSGEGKANQYFLRGYNLDHGTDLAITVDDVPVNMRTHAHGQGYADLNWLIPETIGTMEVRKGPYFADEGDFSSVGSVHIGLIDRTAKGLAQMTAGSFGYRRFLGMDSVKLGDGSLLIAGEAGTYNGP